jgi:hypothetical protein
MSKHKHAALIHAWAEGAKIQYRYSDINPEWTDTDNPTWNGPEYRIKIDQKPDVVQVMSVYRNLYRSFEESRPSNEAIVPSFIADLKLTFDGDTGKLKSLEMLE